MPSRLASFCFGTFRLGVSARLGVIGLFLFPCLAAAATTITPVNPDGTAISNVSNTSAFYPVGNLCNAAGVFLDTVDPTVIRNCIDLAADQGEVNAGNPTNMIEFEITSDKAVSAPAGGKVVVFASVTGSGSSTTNKLIPIASTGGGVSCGGCQGQATIGGITSAYYQAVQYTPGDTIRIGIYPKDICYLYNQQEVGGVTSGGTATSCSSSSAVISDNSSTPMVLSLYVDTVPDSTSAPAIPASPDATISLIFEATAPTFNCPAEMTDIYYPGDGVIYLNSAAFSLSGNYSPLSHLIVLGNDGADPVINSDYASQNLIAQRVGIGGAEKVSGFVNTTNGTDHQHRLGFMARSRSGIVSTASGNCRLPSAGASGGVQTAEIQGFLSSDAKCFIATAAFGSPDAAPVRLLRSFRDRALMKWALGRTFVDWYYAWSPHAADWLRENQLFRVPVLIALFPITLVAGLVVYPISGLILLGLGGLLYFGLRQRRRRQRGLG